MPFQPVDVPMTPAPFFETPLTPESRSPAVLRSSPKTPALPEVLPALLNFVCPWMASPLAETPFIALPLPLLSHSRHAADCEQLMIASNAARAGGENAVTAQTVASVTA